jgi:membrane complex biogenesis BtpA family protein
MFKLSQSDGCLLVGMVHLIPLPGSPGWWGSMRDVLDRARRDAEALLIGGCDALIVENMGDVPYLPREVAPETVAGFAMAAAQVVELGAPTGLQVLAGANRQALGIANAVGAHFIRVEGFAYSHVADEGFIDACAGDLLRARRDMGAEVAIWADVQKKHASHAITGDLTLSDLAHGNAFCGADALIVTGSSTGEPTPPSSILDARAAGLPVAVGSGVNDENVARLVESKADALIVGSWLKKDGNWRRSVDLDRVQRLREILDRALETR